MNKLIFSMIASSLIMSACAKTKEDALVSFNQHKSTYVAIVDQLRQFSDIESVDPDFKLGTFSGDKTYDGKTLAAYDEIIHKMKIADSSFVRSIRGENNSELKGVSFLVPYRFDASKLTKIMYVSQGYKVSNFFPDETVCEIIDSPSWYLCVTDNR